MQEGGIWFMNGTSNDTAQIDTIEVPILAEKIFESIKEGILSHTYLPGQRLNEMKIATALGTSRSPIREALQRLASEGLIKLIPRKGAFVNTIDPKEIRDLFELREALEVLAVRLSTIRAQQSQLEALRKILDKTEAFLKNNQVLTDPHHKPSVYPWNIDFHKQIFRMTFNHKLEEMGSELCTRLRLVRSHSSSKGARAMEALSEHKEIYAAIKSRNPDMAMEATKRHMRNALENLVQMISVSESKGL